jgi:hypothetical protein
MVKQFTKDPSATLDYTIDWSNWLGTDTISTSTWTVPNGLTKESDSNTTTTATVWLSGGTVGEIYTVTNHIVTTSGREDDRSIRIAMAQR